MSQTYGMTLFLLLATPSSFKQQRNPWKTVRHFWQALPLAFSHSQLFCYLKAFCTVRESLFLHQVGDQVPMHGSEARAQHGLCGYEGSSLPKVFVLGTTWNFSFFLRCPSYCKSGTLQGTFCIHVPKGWTTAESIYPSSPRPLLSCSCDSLQWWTIMCLIFLGHRSRTY